MGEDLFKSEPASANTTFTSQNKVENTIQNTAQNTIQNPVQQAEEKIQVVENPQVVKNVEEEKIDEQINVAFNNEAIDLSNISTDNFYDDDIVEVQDAKDVEAVEENAHKADDVRLFVTKTCPNCKKAEELLDIAGIKYSIVDANENPDECERYQIMQAPTLIVNGRDKYVNLSNVIKYVEDTTLAV